MTPTPVRSVVASARRGEARLRAIAAAPVAEVSLPDLLVLLRVGAVLVVVAVALGLQTWARMEVRARAVELADTRSELAAAEILHQRLVLERSLQRQPGRLQQEADGLGLVAPVAVVALAGTP
jgi:Tfp pilus assembly protein FimT